MKDGVLSRGDGRYELRFVRPLAHPVEKVWRGDHIAGGAVARGSRSTSSGSGATGAPLRFVFREGEGGDFTGSMVEFSPHSVMELRWEGRGDAAARVVPDGTAAC